MAGKPMVWVVILLLTTTFLLIKFVQNLPSKKKLLYVPAIVALIVFTTYSLFLKSIYDLPNVESLRKRSIDISTKIYDRNGKLLYAIYKDKNRSLVKADEIPQQIKLATLAAEDASFYEHKGFSIKAISRAFYKLVFKGQVTGGSTITQQLVKNALLSPEKTFARKFRELLLAISVEQKYSKDEILTMYLNEVSYGGTAYGIKEAAHTYFDKNLNELTIAQSALLAGLTKSPSLLSPFGSDPTKAKKRQEEVIELMLKSNFITQAQAKKAKDEKMQFANNIINIEAPHFVMYIKEMLVRQYGEEFLTRSGLEVYTTLDLDIQKQAQNSVTKEVESLENLNVTNGSALVINPQNGDILAMVGSKNYFDENIQGKVNVALSKRPPGSSIKLINYAHALSENYTPASIINDAPVRFPIAGQVDYIPRNYDDKYRGKITLRSALAESRNIPAVKVLNSYGVEKMISLGQKMGITTWEEKNRFGLSLTLGGGEVKLIDLAQAYQVVANKGEKIELASILKIRNFKGETIFERDCEKKLKCKRQEILKPEVAFLLTDILSDNKARSPAFGQYSALVVKDHPEVAVKTGTSNNLRDNLIIGYNQDYLVAVWVGNNDNSPMSRVASGITGASPIWNNIMSSLLKDKESVAWAVPGNLEKQAICKQTGVPSCGCQNSQEYFVKGSFEKLNCIANIKEEPKNNFIPPGQRKKLDKNLN